MAAKYFVEIDLIDFDQTAAMMRAAKRGNSEAQRYMTVILHWLAEAGNRKLGEGFLCATCETEFGPHRNIPHAIILLLPFDGKHPPMATGVCEPCYHAKLMAEPQQYLVDHARKVMPDASLEVGTVSRH